MEALLREAQLLPWGQASSEINNRQSSQSHGDMWIKRKDHTLASAYRLILTAVRSRFIHGTLSKGVFTLRQPIVVSDKHSLNITENHTVLV